MFLRNIVIQPQSTCSHAEAIKEALCIFRFCSDTIKLTAEKIHHSIMDCIPSHKRKALPLRIVTCTSVYVIFIIAHCTYKDQLPELVQKGAYGYLPQVITAVNGLILSWAWNDQKNNISKVIDDSKKNASEKESIALYISADASVDHNFALSEGESKLNDIKLLAQKFIVHSKIVKTSGEVSEEIENVAKNNTLPIKVVVITGHGSLQSICFGNNTYLTADNLKLIAALQKTDINAHIILKSCSTGKLRGDKGISIADQLSLSLPGRTISALSIDSGSWLVMDCRAPQDIMLCASTSVGYKKNSNLVPTLSYSVKNDTRFVTMTIPFYKNDKKSFESILSQYIKNIQIDNQFKTEKLQNDFYYRDKSFNKFY